MIQTVSLVIQICTTGDTKSFTGDTNLLTVLPRYDILRSMFNTKKWSVWDGILDDSKYLKVPDDFWVLFNNMGFIESDMPVLYYMFSRVRETNFLVEVNEKDIQKIGVRSRQKFFRSIRKMITKLDLVRVKNGVYDMSPVLDKLKIVSSIYLTKSK